MARQIDTIPPTINENGAMLVASDPTSPVSVKSVSVATATTPGASVAVATSSGALIAANTVRRYLLLFNSGAADVWVSLGGTAVVGSGIYLPANGGGWEMPPNSIYTGAVTAIGAAASAVAVTEY